MRAGGRANWETCSHSFPIRQKTERNLMKYVQQVTTPKINFQVWGLISLDFHHFIHSTDWLAPENFTCI